MRDRVLFYVNGQPCEAAGRDAFTPVSSYLRETLGLMGTKVVCAEGDCGSCTILLGRPRGGALKYESMCSCIQFVYQVDAAHMITVEGLTYEDALNPVQRAMVKHHGAQCGYCTPGFVVAMCGLLDEPRVVGELTEGTLRRGLVGNLCRCTGYVPILNAGMEAAREGMRPLESLYDSAGIAADLRQWQREAVEVRAGDQRFFKPVTVAAAAAFLGANANRGGCVVISGGTDIGVQVNKRTRELKTVLSTGGLLELQPVTVEKGSIVAGATASLAELERVTLEALPEFGRMLGWFGSPLIKNAGTIGGNVANGSPIGDTMPGLFVLHAQVELTGVDRKRRVDINEFYTGYRQSVMAADELITAVIIPLPAPGELFKIYKVSKRKDLDISTFMAAIWMTMSGSRIEDVRIAFGGVAPTPVRLPRTEAHLRGKQWSEEVFRAAGAVARAEVRPISDVRGAADYRLQLAENIFCKFHAEMTGRGAAASEGPLPAGARH